MATATLEIDQTLLQSLQAQASNQGLSVDALLRKFAENGNQIDSFPQELHFDLATKPTPYELVKDLIGSIDTSVPDSNPDSQPHHTPLGALVAEKLKSQGLKFS